MGIEDYGEEIPGWTELEDGGGREPLLRYSDINETTTRAEKIFATGSDKDMRIMWSVYLTNAYAGAFLAFIGIVSILSSRKVRQNAFNTYLLFLVLGTPDRQGGTPIPISAEVPVY